MYQLLQVDTNVFPFFFLFSLKLYTEGKTEYSISYTENKKDSGFVSISK